MTTAPASSAGLGQAILRLEDERFLTGLGRYIGDIEVPHALHAVFVRSPHAHARIVGIDRDTASKMPGVVTIWTGADVDKVATTLRVAPPIEGLKPVNLPPFPTDKARFVGDPIACVVAETRMAALDAAERVSVEYAPLAPVPDIERARQPNAASVDPEHQTNLISYQTFAAGDLQTAFASASRVVEARFAQHRQTHAPLEPRGCIAEWDAGRRHLTFRCGTQAPIRCARRWRAGLGSRRPKSPLCLPTLAGASD